MCTGRYGYQYNACALADEMRTRFLSICKIESVIILRARTSQSGADRTCSGHRSNDAADPGRIGGLGAVSRSPPLTPGMGMSELTKEYVNLNLQKRLLVIDRQYILYSRAAVAAA